MKTVVTTQKLRLELALATDRRWTVPEWKALFVSKPVMHQFAIGLVWGMYDGNELKETFRYMEDGTFNTREQDEYDLEEAGENNNIGLIHPVELTEDELAEWKEQLDDYEITQPFNQLDRPIYEVTRKKERAGNDPHERPEDQRSVAEREASQKRMVPRFCSGRRRIL